jgi:electron transport complex protein RnfG
MTDWRTTARLALTLAAIAAVASGLIAGTVALTGERIAAEQRRAELAALAAVLPADYDNDPLADRITVLAPEALGHADPVPVLRARRGDAIIGYVLQARAPDGYTAPIDLVIGIAPDGRVLGVRVTRHAETPGLGDPIEHTKSPWIDGFRGRGLGDPPEAAWAVRRDGGEFDQFAGATITPRAVVGAVRRALTWFRDNRATLDRPAEP